MKNIKYLVYSLVGFFLFTIIATNTMAQSVENKFHGHIVKYDSLKTDKEKKSFLRVLSPQEGIIPIPEAKLKLNLQNKYYFLNQSDANKIITEVWGNKLNSNTEVLGMILPLGQTAFDSWGAIISYDAIGYVSDVKAKSQNYASVLSEMNNLDFILQPFYDENLKILSWANSLNNNGKPNNAINYNLRILARYGVVKIKIVSNRDDLELIKKEANLIYDTIEINENAKYSDYIIGDKKSNLELADLVSDAKIRNSDIILSFLYFLAKFGKIIIIGLGTISIIIAIYYLKFSKTKKPLKA